MDSYGAWKAFESTGRVTDYMQYVCVIEGQSNTYHTEGNEIDTQSNVICQSNAK